MAATVAGWPTRAWARLGSRSRTMRAAWWASAPTITASASTLLPSARPTRHRAPSRRSPTTRSLSLTEPGGRRSARARVNSSIPSAKGTKRLPRAPLPPPARRARRAGRPPEGEDEAPVGPLHLEEARHGRRQAQRVGISGVDAGHQRLGHALQRFDTEPAAGAPAPGPAP